MRIRREFITTVGLLTVMAFLMSQTPQTTEANLSTATVDDSSDAGVATATISGPDISASVTRVPVAAIILASEYLRRARESSSGYPMFSIPTRAAPVPRRDQIMIMVDILTFASQPVSRKRILKRLNLSQYQLKKYLGFLIQKHLLLEEIGDRRTYRITEKGSAFLKLIED